MKRLRELRTGLSLPDEAERRLRLLLDLVAEDPDAPTSVRAPEQALDVHIADSLSAVPLLRAHSRDGRLVDIGSGAGFPGLPLAVALEPADVDLLESTRRKCAFIERAIERLGQANAHAVCARAEEWAADEGAGRYTAATVRAVAPLATLVEYAAPLLREGGLLIAWKGAREPTEEEAAREAATALGMSPCGVVRTKPFAGARNHHLHLFEKTGPTPPGYPRRAGVARKRPLGSRSRRARTR